MTADPSGRIPLPPPEPKVLPPRQTKPRGKGNGGNKKGCKSPIRDKPWTLTPEVHAALVESLEAGVSIGGALRAAGVPRRNYYHWKKKAAAGREPYAKLFVDIELAWGRFEDRCVKIIANAATEGDWKAAAWSLERHHSTRERYRATRPTKLDLRRDKREAERLKMDQGREKREAERHARDMKNGPNANQGPAIQVILNRGPVDEDGVPLPDPTCSKSS